LSYSAFSCIERSYHLAILISVCRPNSPALQIALYVFKTSGTRLSSYPEFFCSSRKDGCAIFYESFIKSEHPGISSYVEYVLASLHDEILLQTVPCDPASSLDEKDVMFAVKTYHGNHDTRVPVIKRTWSASLSSIQFFSDVANESIPTVDSGVSNTNRGYFSNFRSACVCVMKNVVLGHCAKTFAILKHFVGVLNENDGKYAWLFIADDDTLLSTPRLLKLLSCHENSKEVIVGERYGYGFSHSDHSGYDYPTGGSGMAFSPPAAKAIVTSCDCPEADSPDDMIIGKYSKQYFVHFL
ncbi:hypothetical protein OESDEN_04303, partial [Oesophagostomum dentatum]